MSGTRGITALRAAGVEHAVHTYGYEARDAALHAAAALGVEPRLMLKSLVFAAGEGFAFALVGADAELSLRAAARELGAKSARMATRAEAERQTGYQVGGISPLGARRPLPVLLDAASAGGDRLWLNAGGRGVIVELATPDLVRMTGAVAAAIADRGDT